MTDEPADVCAATPHPEHRLRQPVAGFEVAVCFRSKNTDAYTLQNERPIAAERVYEPYFSVIGLLDGWLHTHTHSLTLVALLKAYALYCFVQEQMH